MLRYAVSGFLPAIGMSNAEALRANTSVAADHSGMDIDRSRDGSRRVNGRCQVLRLRLADDIDGDLTAGIVPLFSSQCVVAPPPTEFGSARFAAPPVQRIMPR